MLMSFMLTRILKMSSLYTLSKHWSDVVIPTKLKDQVLQETHEGHLGMIKKKQIVRIYV